MWKAVGSNLFGVASPFSTRLRVQVILAEEIQQIAFEVAHNPTIMEHLMPVFEAHGISLIQEGEVSPAIICNTVRALTNTGS